MRENRKKVLFFLPGGVGGAERMSITLSKFLPKEKYDVKYVIVGRLKQIYSFIPDEAQVKVLPVSNKWMLLTLRIFILIKKEQPDFVFSSVMYLNIRLLLAAKMAGVKCIVRNDNTLRFVGADTRFFIKKTYPMAHKIIAQQEEMQEEIIKECGVSNRKCIVLHNPIDTETIDKKLMSSDNPYPLNDNINNVWVGRFSPDKGQDILVKALGELHRSGFKAHVWFVGRYDESTDFFKHIKHDIAEYGIEDYVHFVGYDNNPYRWIKYCDCFVMPSRLEGLPNALVEAQHIGRPCVATECIPMIRRIIKNGLNGYTVLSEDYKAMAEAMRKAYKLGDIMMTYQPATVKDFIRLFE